MSSEDDVYSQNDIINTFIFPLDSRANSVAAIKAMNPKPIKLSRLRQTYTRNEKDAALKLIDSDMYKVDIDKHFLIDHASPDIIMSCQTSHIDALVMVPKYIGLDALLPLHNPDQGFQLELRFGQQIKQLKFKHAQLGFDPTGATMFLG
jgi:hypothetical protein